MKYRCGSAISVSHTYFSYGICTRICTHRLPRNEVIPITNSQCECIDLYRQFTILHRKYRSRNKLITHITRKSQYIVIFTWLYHNIFQFTGCEFSAACTFSEVDYLEQENVPTFTYALNDPNANRQDMGNVCKSSTVLQAVVFSLFTCSFIWMI